MNRRVSQPNFEVVGTDEQVACLNVEERLTRAGLETRGSMISGYTVVARRLSCSANSRLARLCPARDCALPKRRLLSPVSEAPLLRRRSATRPPLALSEARGLAPPSWDGFAFPQRLRARKVEFTLNPREFSRHPSNE